MMPLGAKTAWVIGASSGIGAALAERLAGNGLQVAASARSVRRLDAMQKANGNLFSYPLDVSDHVAANKCANSIIKDFGSIDLVIFCAVRSGIDGEMHENMKAGLDVGLLGATACLQPTIKDMVQRNAGHIAFIGSPVGFRALPSTRTYGTVKSALHYLAESLRVEFGDKGINTQLIIPGFVDTPLTQRNNFQMPFLMSSDDAVERILKGLSSPNTFEVAFPRRLIWTMRLLSFLPNFIYFNLITLLKSKMDGRRNTR